MRKYLVILVIVSVVGLIGLASIVGGQYIDLFDFTVKHCSPANDCVVIDVGSVNAVCSHLKYHANDEYLGNIGIICSVP